MVLTGMLALVILAVILATPVTWLAMLFLGNLGVTQLGFLDILPGTLAIMATRISLSTKK